METKKAQFIPYAIFLFTITVYSLHTTADPTEDKQALLEFKRRITHISHILNWEETSPVCTKWTGVTCNHDESRVVALRLPGMGIRGPVPPNTLSRLSAVQILSLRSNGISGDFPDDFFRLGNLTSLYLQGNRFTGSLPSDFGAWKQSLSVLDLSGNGFDGSIPNSVSNLTHLTSLNLAGNALSGEIPDISVPSLQSLNLTNNHLTGTVPRSLMLRYPTSAFSGNNLSLQPALPPAIPIEPPNPQPSTENNNNKKLSEQAILGIVLGTCVVGFFTVAILMICCYSEKKAKKDTKLPTSSNSNKKKKKEDHLSKNDSDDHRLVFFEGCSLAFDLEDLLRASAEVMGKGTYGTTYKAALEDARTVAVKRLKEVTVARKDFENRMEVVGRIKHENVCALRAYYYSKDEKLMVYDFYDKGSLSVMLHGKRGEDRTPLDWETRMRVAMGAAKGIAYIHTHQTKVHGNIKSSNIFLNSDGYGSISDLGLATLMNPIPTPVQKSGTGYRAPEILDPRKATSASDVYSFGVLILELLTGKSPTSPDVNLVRWVNSVVREEWTAEVFDLELLRYPNIEEEMVEMLQIGMSCVARMSEQRPKMADVVKMIGGIRQISSEASHALSSDAGVGIAMSTPTPPASDAGTSSGM